MTRALEAVQALVAGDGEADDVLRGVVDALVSNGAASWAGILFSESGRLVLGPEAGVSMGSGRVQVPVVYEGARVGELAAEGCEDRAVLDQVAALLPEHCLVGWDTGGAAWNP